MMKLAHILILVGTIVISLGIGILIGYVSFKTKKDEPINSNNNNNQEYDESKLISFLAQEIKADNIRNHLRNMTLKSHMAGTAGDKESADYVYKAFQSFGLDYVKYLDYDVYLSFPDETKPNSLEFIDSNGIKEEVKIVEPIYDPELNDTYIPRPFLGYSQNGSFTSNKIYYANYARLEDFKHLQSKGYVLNDSIVICRYGKIFRGNKVKLATQYGAKAVLIYDDPIRSAPENTNVYPNGEFLPKEGMQRGTLLLSDGDPLTPFYPSTENAYRIPENESAELPTILAQVISYETAERVFKMMEDNQIVVDDEWKGSMNVIYTYGGLLKNNEMLTVNIYNKRKIATTYNVMGVIKGLVEPDRFIMVGNHRDAWVLGAIDPTSGTASLIEMARALKKLQTTQGWKPRRSIIFMNWGAEEYGLIGSTEFVEEFTQKLKANAIAYLNTDASVQGNYSFTATASPLIFDLILNVTKEVKINDTLSVFDRWLQFEPNEDKTKPDISAILGSGSDHTPIQQRIGIVCMDSFYVQDINDPKYKTLGWSYATYHTSYETFQLVDKFIDPGFKTFKVYTNVIAEMARRLADSVILPFNVREYSNEMKRVLNIIKTRYGKHLNEQNISLTGLENTIKNYSIVADQFQIRLNKIDKSKPLLVRQYNDQLKDLEKSFLDFSGIKRNGYMHMLSAPSLYNSYGGDGFPALDDAIFNAIESSTPLNWEEVKRQLAILIYTIQSSITMLTESHSFDRFA